MTNDQYSMFNDECPTRIRVVDLCEQLHREVLLDNLSDPGCGGEEPDLKPSGEGMRTDDVLSAVVGAMGRIRMEAPLYKIVASRGAYPVLLDIWVKTGAPQMGPNSHDLLPDLLAVPFELNERLPDFGDEFTAVQLPELPNEFMGTPLPRRGDERPIILCFMGDAKPDELVGCTE